MKTLAMKVAERKRVEVLLSKVAGTLSSLPGTLSSLQVQPRVEAHIFVTFMGYCVMTTLRKHLEPSAPGLSPKAVLEQLAAIQRVDVCLPTSDGRWLILPRHTEPEPEQQMLLEKLGLVLPPQPPPRIRSGKLLLPEPAAEAPAAG